jgi:hypothetical protein
MNTKAKSKKYHAFIGMPVQVPRVDLAKFRVLLSGDGRTAPAGDGGIGMGMQDELHVFVNRRRFDAAKGLKAVATGADIAALAGVPRDNAKVEVEAGPDRMQEVGIDERIEIRPGMQFLVTREFVLGG